MAAVNMNQQQFQHLMEEGKAVLVDFWAPWCTYRRRIGPAFDKVAQQHGRELVVVKTNIDEEPLLANQEMIEVIPTLVMYQNGKAIGSIVAPESKAMIDAFILDTLKR